VNLVVAPSTALSALTVSRGSLSPSFDGGVFAYFVSVGYDVNEINLVATTAVVTSLLSVNGVAETSAVQAGPYPLIVGNTTVVIEVTAQGGGFATVYTLVISRAPGFLFVCF